MNLEGSYSLAAFILIFFRIIGLCIFISHRISLLASLTHARITDLSVYTEELRLSCPNCVPTSARLFHLIRYPLYKNLLMSTM